MKKLIAAIAALSLVAVAACKEEEVRYVQQEPELQRYYGESDDACEDEYGDDQCIYIEDSSGSNFWMYIALYYMIAGNDRYTVLRGDSKRYNTYRTKPKPVAKTTTFKPKPKTSTYKPKPKTTYSKPKTSFKSGGFRKR